MIPYPPIERHGVVGDRRTAALVAADGTIDWLCLPNYDSTVVFGALLDAERGGFWRLGPESPTLGRQRYLDDSAALVTSWDIDGARLELTDMMIGPQDDRPEGEWGRRLVLRRLRCTRGQATCVLEVRPRDNFAEPAQAVFAPGGLSFHFGQHTLGLWASRAVDSEGGGARASFILYEDEEVWATLGLDESPKYWSVPQAQSAFQDTVGYWREWLDHLTYTGPRGDRVKRSALLVHLLSYAPAGSLVAAPTTSLPERIGGDRNYDYRFAWIRDASLSLAALALLGDTRGAARYMDWLAGLGSSTEAPLQVVYRIDGGTDLTQHERSDVAGYRGSRPLRLGNHAFSQRQLDSLGYLADCALIYLQQGGIWRDEYWEMVRRAADFTAATWREPDSGIWELPAEAHYLSGKVMAWVALERAVKIAEQTHRTEHVARWQQTMREINADVMDRGWSERLQAFRQRYEADGLDAAALLIPVMGFLPADHPRVLATVDRIVESLAIDGFVHRFEGGATPGEQDLPVGQFEGAFLPCTFWLATTLAKLGLVDQAERILERAEAVAGHLGLFAEEVDSRAQTFLGNFPLLFSQVEYVRAIVEVAKSRPLDRARLGTGMLQQRVSRFLQPLTGSEYPLAVGCRSG